MRAAFCISVGDLRSGYFTVLDGVSLVVVLDFPILVEVDFASFDIPGTILVACDTGEVEINLAVISFGGDVTYDIPLQPVLELSNIQLQANGGTPMGAALSMAKDLLEDKEIIPSKGYRPAIVLVSDGAPTDAWESPMENFVKNGRSSKCQRFAMAIGTSQDDPVLNKFMEGMEMPVYLATDATKIREFFKFVTMSVSQRSKSQNPNILPSPISQSQNMTDLARGFGIDL